MTNRIQKIEKAINNLSNEKFNELLNDLGVNEEQWVPEYDKRYWYVATPGFCLDTFWTNNDFDRRQLLMNNVFKTEEEAEAQRDFNIEKAKLIKEIKDSSDVIDWENGRPAKYHLYLLKNELGVDISFYRMNQGTQISTTNLEFLENLIKNEPERVKKYLF